MDDRAGTYPLLGGAEVRWAWWELDKSPTKQKNSSTSCECFFFGSSSRPRVWKRLRVCDHHGGAHDVAKRKCLHQQAESILPVRDRMVVG